MTLWSKYSEKLVWLLLILGVMGQKGMIDQNLHAWFNTAPSTTTAGLWANRDESQEWLHVLDLVKGNSSVVLVYDGSAELLFAGIAQPAAAALERGQTTASELRRKLDQFSTAQIAIIPEVLNNADFLNAWPEFKDALPKWGVVVFKGKYFTVYRHSDSRAAITF